MSTTDTLYSSPSLPSCWVNRLDECSYFLVEISQKENGFRTFKFVRGDSFELVLTETLFRKMMVPT